MAISPEELSTAYQEKLKRFEEEIDRSLMNKRGTQPNNINVDVPRDMSSRDFELIKIKYIQAGWKNVEYHSDQREGEWLTFKSDIK